MLCPCHSKQPYFLCCESFHKGETSPKTALELMRSRYAAYALNLPSYIQKTTHPSNPLYQQDFQKWRRELEEFSTSYTFEDLEIIQCEETKTWAKITFIASLRSQKGPFILTETSEFERVKGKWLYRSGQTYPNS